MFGSSQNTTGPSYCPKSTLCTVVPWYTRWLGVAPNPIVIDAPCHPCPSCPIFLLFSPIFSHFSPIFSHFFPFVSYFLPFFSLLSSPWDIISAPTCSIFQWNWAIIQYSFRQMCGLLLLHPEIKVSDRKVSEIVGAPLSLPAALSFVNWNTNNK